MQEHIYTASKKRIIKQSLFLLFYSTIHLFTNIICIPLFIEKNQGGYIILINILLGVFSIPSIHIFRNYYRYSVSKRLIITYNSLQLLDDQTGTIIEINNSEIEKITLTENIAHSKLPWSDLSYFSITDSAHNTIIVTSFIMNISDLWMDTLAQKISSTKLIREEKLYPIIK